MSTDCKLETVGLPDTLGRYRRRCTQCGYVSKRFYEPQTTPRRRCNVYAGKPAEVQPILLTEAEQKDLFGDADPSLLGNRIARITASVGIPACNSCNERKKWLNRAHAWLREQACELL